MRKFGIGAASLLLATSPVAAQTTDPAAVATSAEVQALVERMGSEMKPGQIIAWKPLVRAGASIAAIEYWTAPGKPASHPTDAEYVIVIAGSGTLISGGVIVDAHVTNPHLTEGSRIEGATTQPIKAGDVLMIGAGVPHYFGVDGGKLALLGIKLPLPSTTPTP